MVVDTGLFTDAAITLSKKFKKVYYCNPGWVGATPRQNDAEIGKGMEGIELVSDIHIPEFDSIDLFVFFDIYFGQMQVWLEGQGKAVWGSRMAEEFEIDRIKCREAMCEVGLPCANYEVITGMDKLRAFLKENDDKFVKTNKWRGTMETLYAKNYKFACPRLDKLEYDLGPFAKATKFLVEDSIPDCAETGVDAWCIDGKFPKHHMGGVEIKDLCYVARMLDRVDIPEPVRRWEEKMAPKFKALGYRGFYSTEVRIGKDKVPYMIDATMRLGSPPGELEQFLFTNFADIIWFGANGIMQEPETEFEYGAQAIISSPWAEENFQPISFPEKFREHIKLRNAVKIDGEYYCVPQEVGACEIGSVVTGGDTLEEAIAKLAEVADEISGYQIKIPLHAFEDAEAELGKLKKFGLDFIS